VSARLLLGLGLMATAAVNLAFGASSSMTAFCTLWGINGMLQVRCCCSHCEILQHALGRAWAPCMVLVVTAGGCSTQQRTAPTKGIDFVWCGDLLPAFFAGDCCSMLEPGHLAGMQRC
jgi:hypothetical protein